MKDIKCFGRCNLLNYRISVLLSVSLLALFLFSEKLCAQNKDITPQLEKALSAGNSSDIALHFADHVNLAIPGTDGVYSKEQAGVILKDFFSRNKPTQFKITHKGKSGEGASYFVGTLKCGNKKFSLYVLMRDAAKMPTIRQFQIEAD